MAIIARGITGDGAGYAIDDSIYRDISLDEMLKRRRAVEQKIYGIALKVYSRAYANMTEEERVAALELADARSCARGDADAQKRIQEKIDDICREASKRGSRTI